MSDLSASQQRPQAEGEGAQQVQPQSKAEVQPENKEKSLVNDEAFDMNDPRFNPVTEKNFSI